MNKNQMVIPGFTQKLDSLGNPVLNIEGQPIYTDSSGNQITVKQDKSGKPVVDSSGNPLFQDLNGNTLKPQFLGNKLVLNSNPIGMKGFLEKLDENGNQVLNEKGQAVFVDQSGNQVFVDLDEQGNCRLDECG
jgi:hypothetical protein